MKILFSYHKPMLTAKQADDMIKNMTPEERLEALKDKVKAKTREALDKKIRETIAAYERDISIVLKASVCIDRDEDIRALLKALGYVDVKVTSDFP